MFKSKKRHKTDGQGMVEFALVLPIVLLIVFGVIEFGYLLFVFSSVNTASRDAARYGIAVGDVSGDLRYYDCDGIVGAGQRIGRFAGILETEYTITYDSGPGTSAIYADCPTLAAHDGVDNIYFGDRIVVTVNHAYQPLVTFMGLNVGPFTMSSTSSRTIVKGANILVEP
jgi:Flp pilus assembly protein TadG